MEAKVALDSVDSEETKVGHLVDLEETRVVLDSAGSEETKVDLDPVGLGERKVCINAAYARHSHTARAIHGD